MENEIKEILFICLKKLSLEEGRNTIIEVATTDPYTIQIYEIKRKRNRVDW